LYGVFSEVAATKAEEVLKQKWFAPETPAGDLCYKNFHTFSLILECPNEYNTPFLVIRTLVNSVLSSRAPQPAVAIPRSFREENPSFAAMQQVACSLLSIACSPGLAHEKRLQRHQPSFVAFPSGSLFAAYLETGVLAALLGRTNKYPLLLMLAVAGKHIVGFVRAFSFRGTRY
jgi:hypothetical protein